MTRQKNIIAPSILSADLAQLGKECKDVLKAGADWIHFDVMDNHYVPNLTFGPMVCKALRNYGITAPIDVHLMVQPVDELIVKFAQAGASYISIHPETSNNIFKSLQLIRDHDCKAGVAFNPEIKVNIDQFLDKIDLVLLMSVNPGFSGQEIIPEVKSKIKYTRNLLDKTNLNIRLEIDGGVKISNLSDIVAAGADTIVAGSAIFDSDDYVTTIKQMREILSKYG